jgi:response regulator RpfG family c-di-GMP phosphodiesterase
MLKQCRVLLVNYDSRQTAHRQALERRGFLVAETREWPDDEVVAGHEVVIVVLRDVDTTGMLAARMRAKRWFGNRVLIGVSPSTASAEQRRNAIAAGFDDLVDSASDSRTLLARILQRLHARPEHRCLLPDRKRSAA